jgi:hypothetical protein
MSSVTTNVTKSPLISMLQLFLNDFEEWPLIRPVIWIPFLFHRLLFTAPAPRPPPGLLHLRSIKIHLSSIRLSFSYVSNINHGCRKCIFNQKSNVVNGISFSLILILHVSFVHKTM